MDTSKAEANAIRSAYVYTPLAKDRPQIRLLRLLPKDPQDRIDALEVSLDTFDLVAAPAYTALSYEWGTKSNQASILIDASVFTIRRNLHDFFEDYIAATDRLGYLWIDQISIDQTCIEERNQQVMLMSMIYEGAEQVIAWLGRSTLAEACLECITKFTEVRRSWEHTRRWSFEPEPDFSTNPVLAHHFDHLYQFCGISYWSRHWVAQELVASRSCSIMYGRHTVSLESVMSLQSLCAYKASLANSSFKGLMAFVSNVRAYATGRIAEDSLLWTAAAGYGEFSHCEDLRDKVYGIQNVLPKWIRIPVDYRLSVKEVFVRAASAYLEDSIISASEKRRVPTGVYSLAAAMGLAAQDDGPRFDRLQNQCEQL